MHYKVVKLCANENHQTMKEETFSNIFWMGDPPIIGHHTANHHHPHPNQPNQRKIKGMFHLLREHSFSCRLQNSQGCCPPIVVDRILASVCSMGEFEARNII